MAKKKKQLALPSNAELVAKIRAGVKPGQVHQNKCAYKRAKNKKLIKEQQES